MCAQAPSQPANQPTGSPFALLLATFFWRLISHFNLVCMQMQPYMLIESFKCKTLSYNSKNKSIMETHRPNSSSAMHKTVWFPWEQMSECMQLMNECYVKLSYERHWNRKCVCAHFFVYFIDSFIECRWRVLNLYPVIVVISLTPMSLLLPSVW